MNKAVVFASGLCGVLCDVFVVLLTSTSLAQITKKTPHAQYYFYLVVILSALSINIY